MIKDKKKLPKALSDKQELQRQETINKVLRACADIQNEGSKVTISALVEYTELSRSVFAKPHIRELLTEHGYASNGGEDTKVSGKKPSKKASDKDRLIAELRVRNAELDQECELLRGRLFLMIQKMN